MTIYAGLDVSDKTTHICVVGADGAVVRRDCVASDPDVLARWLKRHCSGLTRVVLETGPLSAFLYHGLVERDVPVTCICARHAKGVLSTRVNKSDPHDAEGLAQLARTGWFKAVRIKDEATHITRAQLKIREQLVSAHGGISGDRRGYRGTVYLLRYRETVYLFARRDIWRQYTYLRGGISGDSIPWDIRGQYTYLTVGYLGTGWDIWGIAVTGELR